MVSGTITKGLIMGKIGRVIEVRGDTILFECFSLEGDNSESKELREILDDLTISSFIKIPFKDTNVIGIVTNIRVVDNPIVIKTGGEKTAKPGSRTIAETTLIGRLEGTGKYERGVPQIPSVNNLVYILAKEDIEHIFQEFKGDNFSFGKVSGHEDEDVYLKVNKFFGRHVAILGTTGSGKSCAVASILQSISENYEHPNIVILDIHGEYKDCFKDKAVYIPPDDIELPYWILTFDEFTDLAIDVKEFSAHNQIMILQKNLRELKEESKDKDGLVINGPVTSNSPIYFDIRDLISRITVKNEEMVQGTSGRSRQGDFYGNFTKFLVRLGEKVTDARYGFLFDLNKYNSNKTLIDLVKEAVSYGQPKITVFDLSSIPSDTVGVLVSVITRIISNFKFWSEDREKYPILIVYEEAHNYVSKTDISYYRSAKLAVEKIAKEGRKYGIGIFVVSQRPRELSETVISQCNSFVSLRLSNPDDQNYVKRLLPDSYKGLIDILPALETGEAIIIGDSIILPTRTKINLPNPKPASDDADFHKYWSEGPGELNIEEIVTNWRSRKKK